MKGAVLSTPALRDTDRLELPMPSHRTCIHPSCSRPHFGYGYCHSHYRKWLVRGTEITSHFDLDTPTALQRFFEHVEFGDCWMWTGPEGRHGYSRFHAQSGAGTGAKSKPQPAYRWLYVQVVGPIPDGYHLDHLCRVRLCVSPDHLEPVTPGENNRRAAMTKTHCPYGHPYSGPNLKVDQKGHRICRACRTASAVRQNLKKKLRR